MSNFNGFDVFNIFKTKKYWQCLAVVLGCCVAMLLMFVPLILLIGDKEMEEFLAFDWVVFVAFAIIELALLFLMVAFCVKIVRLGLKKANEITNSYFGEFQFVGLQDGDYDDVWLDFKGIKRAIILQKNGVFNVTLEKFNTIKNPWMYIADEQYLSEEELKRGLFYEHYFYCESNADIDEFGDVTFKN
ncbi:MAG: hypothetical protein IKY44_00715 [Clostridia bacterium]|nr:hypothetical protein [Clostridia bacterium]